MHSYNVPVRECAVLCLSVLLRRDTEIKVREIEISTHVPKKFRFPHFVKCVHLIASSASTDVDSDSAGTPQRSICAT